VDFELKLSTAWTVKFADMADDGWNFDRSQGVCWLRLNAIEQAMAQGLAAVSVGERVGKYLFGLDITDAPAGFDGEEMRGLVLFRRSDGCLVSVGQLAWPEIRHVDAKAQFEEFQACALGAAERAAAKPRLPRDFDAAAFLAAVTAGVLGLEFADCVTEPFTTAAQE
jgi:hypothetical protein